MKHAKASLLLGLLVLLAAAPSAQQKPLRPPDVPFDPSPTDVVEEMLQLAGVRKGDVVYDLGCGDGRIVIAAARQFGARGVGIDIDPERIKESIENARTAGVQDRVTFRNEDLFEARIAEATVVTLFLWPGVNMKLRPKLWRELKPGTRVVSYYWNMGDWVPDKQIEMHGHEIYLWTIPPKQPAGSPPEPRLSRTDPAIVPGAAGQPPEGQPAQPGTVSSEARAACDLVYGIAAKVRGVSIRRSTGTARDEAFSAPIQGCQLAISGSFARAEATGDAAARLREGFAALEWREMPAYAADGMDGTSYAFRKENAACFVRGRWNGGADDEPRVRAEDWYTLSVLCTSPPFPENRQFDRHE